MIYLSTPYSHPLEAVRKERWLEAVALTQAIMSDGTLVFSPIVYSCALVEMGAPDTWEFWREIDKGFLTKSSMVLFAGMDGLAQSVGCREEWCWARKLMIPINYLAYGDDAIARERSNRAIQAFRKKVGDDPDFEATEN